MFFIVSKIFDFLMAPISWILILLIWMIIVKSKKTKKKLLYIIILVAIIFSNHFIYRTFVLAWQIKPANLEKGKSYSAGILLGGFTGFDVDKRGYFNEAADRFIQAEKLYHLGFIQKIIISGGSGQLFNNEAKEADFVKGELIASGVKENDIIIENSSRNTYENAVFSKKIIDSLQLKGPYVLITSATHMPRSIKIFEKAGMKIISFPSDYHVFNSHISFEDFVIPKLKLLNEWGTIFHEIIGLKVYQLTGKA